METWPAEATAPEQACLERVAGCQLVIALVAFRRGYIPPGQDDSITQLECTYAKSNGIDILPFLLADDVTDWPLIFDERAKDPQLLAWRQQLRPHAGSDYTLFRTSPESLDVLPSVMHWHNRRTQGDRLASYLRCVRDTHSKITFLGLPSLVEQSEPHIDQLFVMPSIAVTSSYVSFHRNATTQMPLEDVLSQHQRLIILGDPGSGKSTLVSWVAYHMTIKAGYRWGAAIGDMIPMVFILRDLGIIRGISWNDLVDRFLRISAHSSLTRQEFDSLLATGRSLLMFDGLDEIGDIQTRREFRSMIHRIMDDYPKARWLLTSRVVGYEAADFHYMMGATAFAVQVAQVSYIEPFSDNQIREFSSKWYALREMDHVVASQKAIDLVDAINRDAGTKRLAGTPNLLTLMALVHRNKADLPHGKALLYHDIAQAYLESIDEVRRISGVRSTLREKKRWLGYVAFQAMLQRIHAGSGSHLGSGAIAIEGDTFRTWLGDSMRETGKVFSPDYIRTFLDQVKQRSGLVIERAPDQFTFIHLSFQEYFAAYYLQSRFIVPSIHVAQRPELHRYAGESGWQESLIFLFETIADECPDWMGELSEACFGNWAQALLVGAEDYPRAALLARLATDPYVRWSKVERELPIRLCVTWALRLQQNVSADHQYVQMDVGSLAVLALVLGSIEDSSGFLRIVADIARENKFRYLNLAGCNISDLSVLQDLPDLRWLSLRDTNITNVEPLTHLHQLEALFIQNTRVTDLSPLLDLYYLKLLSVTGANVVGRWLSPMKARHPNLKWYIV